MRADSANRATIPPRTTSRANGELTEAEFLAAEALAAKGAMRATLAEMGSDLGRGLNPLRWTRKHPWLALTAAAIGGFAAASVAVPSKEQQTLRKLRRLQEAMRPPAPKESPSHMPKGDTAGHGNGGWVGLLVRQLIGLIRPVVVSLLSAAISTRHAPPQPPPPAPGDADPSSTPPL